MSVPYGFGDGVGMLMGVGRPCPPGRDDIVTPHYLTSAVMKMIFKLCIVLFEHSDAGNVVLMNMLS